MIKNDTKSITSNNLCATCFYDSSSCKGKLIDPSGSTFACSDYKEAAATSCSQKLLKKRNEEEFEKEMHVICQLVEELRDTHGIHGNVTVSCFGNAIVSCRYNFAYDSNNSFDCRRSVWDNEYED